jgi:transcriptional regulator of acetoin/glycerol metabolism
MLPLEKMLDPVELARYSSNEENISQKNHTIIEQIRKIKNEVLNNSAKDFNQDLVRSEIVESWVRSKKFGIDPSRLTSGRTLERSVYEEIISNKVILLMLQSLLFTA